MPRSEKSELNSSYFAGVMRSSSKVAPGIGAVAAANCLAFSRIRSLVLEAKSSVVTIALGAIPNSLRSLKKKNSNRITYIIWKVIKHDTLHSSITLKKKKVRTMIQLGISRAADLHPDFG